jgi:hypothetical protein
MIKYFSKIEFAGNYLLSTGQKADFGHKHLFKASQLKEGALKRLFKASLSEEWSHKRLFKPSPQKNNSINICLRAFQLFRLINFCFLRINISSLQITKLFHNKEVL